MSVAYKCDRCGVFCDGPANGSIAFKHDGAREWRHPTNTTQELCFTCSMRFVEWFNLATAAVTSVTSGDAAIANTAGRRGQG